MRLIISIALLFLLGCGSNKIIIRDADRDKILVMNQDLVLQPYELAPTRFEVIRDSALMYSAQCSLRFHYHIINEALKNKASLLDKIYNFQPIMLDHDILPPVVIQSDRSIEKVSSNHLIIADKTFKILKDAAFLTTPLTWREYLIENILEPAVPDKSFLPGNNLEKEVWAKYVEQGWEAGKEQAFRIFSNNIDRLNQEYLGMIAFHRLFQQGLMTAPIINEIENGVTMNADVMNINQRILAIAQQGFLEGDYQRWHSYIFFTE
ncbi:hypothetical protein EBR43_04245 [bacterium]|nr:hypothetical protein [bacterium]NBW56990.1 hypothetical protein [bacterium]NBX71939.1 hypothetical protein [bacterium]